MLRILEDRRDRTHLDDASGIHDRHMIGDLRDHAEIVGDQDHRRPRLLLEAADEREDLGLDGHVERRGRLVGDEELRSVGEGHGDHGTLAHAPRELVRIGVEALLGPRNAHQLQHVQGLGPGLAFDKPR